MTKYDKQAYLIMAHADIRLLNALISALDSPYGDIFLHIDAKSTLHGSEVLRPRYSKIYFMEPMSVYWADYSQTECELRLLSFALSKGLHQYFHLLSGADFPLMSSREIAAYYTGRDDIYLHYSTGANLNYCKGYVQYYHFFQPQLSSANRSHSFSPYKVLNALSLAVQKTLRVDRCKAHFYTPKKGANWFSIPRDFANYVVSEREIVYQRFRLTRSSDEFFMQTLAFESDEYRRRLYRFAEDDSYESCLRMIEWEEGAPHVYTNADYERLTSSGRFFARKFDSNIDFEIINRLMHRVREDGESAYGN